MRHVPVIGPHTQAYQNQQDSTSNPIIDPSIWSVNIIVQFPLSYIVPSAPPAGLEWIKRINNATKIYPLDLTRKTQD